MSDYCIKEIPEEEFMPLWENHRLKLFDENSPLYRLRDHFSTEEERNWQNLKSLMGNPFRLCLGVYKDNEFVGWAYGYQENATRFYMCNSAILPEHRRKGLYTRLLHAVIERVTQMGFQEIYSNHKATNNAILIPKLTAGFKITGFSVKDTFGVLVTLTLFTNEFRHKLLDYRVGEIKPDDEIKEKLGL